MCSAGFAVLWYELVATPGAMVRPILVTSSELLRQSDRRQPLIGTRLVSTPLLPVDSCTFAARQFAGATARLSPRQRCGTTAHLAR